MKSLAGAKTSVPFLNNVKNRIKKNAEQINAITVIKSFTLS